MARPCQTCAHPDLHEVEAAAKKSIQEASEKYGLSKTSLYGHMQKHISKEVPVEKGEDLSVKSASVSGSSLERAQELLKWHYSERARLVDTDAAETARSQNSNSILATEKMIADLTGAFEVTPAQIVKSPHFNRVLDLMFGLLKERWPDALLACRKLLRQEAGLED